MSTNKISVKVSPIKQVSPSIREFTFTSINEPLSTFSPGSHIIVEMTNNEKTYRNAYSLLSDPFDSSNYRIAVRLQDNSRGGSVYMHEHVQVGDEMYLSPPANSYTTSK